MAGEERRGGSARGRRRSPGRRSTAGRLRSARVGCRTVFVRTVQAKEQVGDPRLEAKHAVGRPSRREIPGRRAGSGETGPAGDPGRKDRRATSRSAKEPAKTIEREVRRRIRPSRRRRGRPRTGRRTRGVDLAARGASARTSSSKALSSNRRETRSNADGPSAGPASRARPRRGARSANHERRRPVARAAARPRACASGVRGASTSTTTQSARRRRRRSAAGAAARSIGPSRAARSAATRVRTPGSRWRADAWSRAAAGQRHRRCLIAHVRLNVFSAIDSAPFPWTRTGWRPIGTGGIGVGERGSAAPGPGSRSASTTGRRRPADGPGSRRRQRSRASGPRDRRGACRSPSAARRVVPEAGEVAGQRRRQHEHALVRGLDVLSGRPRSPARALPRRSPWRDWS